MCKIYGYRYSCGHHVRYLHSRCRGTFVWGRNRSRPIAACVADYYILIASPSECGSCQSTKSSLERDARTEAARTGSYEARQQPAKATILSPVSNDEANKGKRDEGTAPEKFVSKLQDAFSGSPRLSKSESPPRFRRERYQRSRCHPRCIAPSRLRTELHPEDITEPAERRVPLSPASHSTFRSFFMQTYGSSGPDVDIHTRTASGQSLTRLTFEDTQEAPAPSVTAPNHDVRCDVSTAEPHDRSRLVPDIEGGTTPASRPNVTIASATLYFRPGNALNAGRVESAVRPGGIRT